MTPEVAKIISGWLTEAADDIESWGAYASDYFQHKHHLQDAIDLTRARAKDVLEMANHDSQHEEKRQESKVGTSDKGRRT